MTNIENDPIVIVSTKRTPIGDFLGAISALTAAELGSAVIAETLKAVDFPNNQIDEVILGCVLPAGQGQAPARQATLKAGLPDHTPCTTINKMCGSGMKAMMFAHDLLLSGQSNIIIAGGMESMSNAPYLLPRARTGYRMGHQTAQDHMFLDGLEDAYDKGKLMGVFAEQTAERFHLSREAQDQFALASLDRAQKAIKNKWFMSEITPLQVTQNKEIHIINDDQLPLKARPDKIPTLKPAFQKDGTVTAANSSAISDGAAVHLMMRRSEADKRGLKPLATIKAHATHAQKPAEFTIAPIGAIEKVLAKSKWQKSDVDLFEINEAFAVVTLAALKQLELPHEIVNIYGGACALGHPIGASGARIVTTLIHALKQKGLRRGIAALCIGGGEATALAIEVA
ncbi:MAG: acetyl-CoA C-acyltransferase [Gammaproteobacteria bacterium]